MVRGSHAVDDGPAGPGSVGRANDGGLAGGGRGTQRRWHYRVLLALLAVVAAGCVAGLVKGAADVAAAVASPGAVNAATSAGGTGVIRVLATGQVQPGPRFLEVNGIADGVGGVWLTGGDARHAHVLYAVNPETGRTDGSALLPSRLVMNPSDVAVGSGAVWVAVGAGVYRVEPVSTVSGGVVTRPFAALPHGGLIGALGVGAGSVWATDITRGEVYRFSASTGRLQAQVPARATTGALAVGDGGVWVADAAAHTVSRINMTRNRVDATLTVPGVPADIAASQSAVWVTEGAAGAVTAFQGASGRALTVHVGGDVTGVAATGGTVWVTDTAHGTLSKIDARHHVVMATVPVGTRPYAVAADRGGAWVATLGTPVMVHTSSPTGRLSRAAQLFALLQRLCGL